MKTEFERDAERLFTTVAASCVSKADFATRVRAGLDAALGLLAAEPELARSLTLSPPRQDEALKHFQSYWLDRYSELLARAAKASPQTSLHPLFLEPMVIGGVRQQIAEFVRLGQAARLPDLAPNLSLYILTYYVPAAAHGGTA